MGSLGENSRDQTSTESGQNYLTSMISDYTRTKSKSFKTLIFIGLLHAKKTEPTKSHARVPKRDCPARLVRLKVVSINRTLLQSEALRFSAVFPSPLV